MNSSLQADSGTLRLRSLRFILLLVLLLTSCELSCMAMVIWMKLPWGRWAGGVSPDAGKQFSSLLTPALFSPQPPFAAVLPIPAFPVAVFVSVDIDVDVFVDIVGRHLCIVVVVYTLVLLTNSYLVSAIQPFFWTQVGVWVVVVPAIVIFYYFST